MHRSTDALPGACSADRRVSRMALPAPCNRALRFGCSSSRLPSQFVNANVRCRRSHQSSSSAAPLSSSCHVPPQGLRHLLTRSRHIHTVHAADGAASTQPWPEDGSPGAASRPAGASMDQTVFNLVNVIMGAGYVSIPFALNQGGWAALGVLWLLGLVFCYTGVVLLQCCRRLEQDPASKTTTTAQQQQQDQQQPKVLAPYTTTYEDLAAAAFGALGRQLVSGVMYAELLGICCVYIVLEAETLAILLTGTPLGDALVTAAGPQAWGLLAAAIMLPTVLLPDLAALSLLGAVGVLAALTVGLVVGWLYLSGAVPPVPGPRPLLLGATLPSVLGILAFVYAGHSTFPIIQQSMQQPQMGPRAIKLGYAATALICTLLGVFGYMLYGPTTTPSITGCLPAATAVALVCTALTAANPFSAFALTLEPVALALQQMLPGSSSSGSGSGVDQGGGQVPYPVRAAVRLGLAAACAAVALSLPYVADLMAFVGALLTMSISLIIPALMHLRLVGQELSLLEKTLDGGVLLLGVTCATVGATSAWINIRQKMAAAAAGLAAGGAC